MQLFIIFVYMCVCVVMSLFEGGYTGVSVDVALSGQFLVKEWMSHGPVLSTFFCSHGRFLLLTL